MVGGQWTVTQNKSRIKGDILVFSLDKAECPLFCFWSLQWQVSRLSQVKGTRFLARGRRALQRAAQKRGDAIGLLSDLLKEYPAVAVAKERLLLMEHKNEALEAELQSLKDENKRLLVENDSLRKAATTAEYVEVRCSSGSRAEALSRTPTVPTARRCSGEWRRSLSGGAQNASLSRRSMDENCHGLWPPWWAAARSMKERAWTTNDLQRDNVRTVASGQHQ
ncbi:MAG: hypothetical protein HYX69_03195 [Planctomycetia bacterium]|nr:hypothetical protein [Planctomycetia bacterium]